MYPWYFLCSRMGFLGMITHRYPLVSGLYYMGISHRGLFHDNTYLLYPKHPVQPKRRLYAPSVPVGTNCGWNYAKKDHPTEPVKLQMSIINEKQLSWVYSRTSNIFPRCAITKTYPFIRSFFWWPNIVQENVGFGNATHHLKSCLEWQGYATYILACPPCPGCQSPPGLSYP